jgi:hypothetical protein
LKIEPSPVHFYTSSVYQTILYDAFLKTATAPPCMYSAQVAYHQL